MRYRPLDLTFAAALLALPIAADASHHHSAAPSSKNQTAPQKPAPRVDDVLVWVDLATSVFYLPGDSLWGRTLSGQYMSESNAIAAGLPRHARQQPITASKNHKPNALLR